MLQVCTSCKRSVPADRWTPGPISHGICTNCLAELEFQRMPLRAFLEMLPGPVMALDGEGRVLSANSEAAFTVNKDLPHIEGALGGDVISCIYADLPGGCGKTVHCTGCTIRRLVDRTRATGEVNVEAPAYAFLHGPRGPIRHWFLLSTERIGAVVLLRIDGGGPTPGDESEPADAKC